VERSSEQTGTLVVEHTEKQMAVMLMAKQTSEQVTDQMVEQTAE